MMTRITEELSVRGFPSNLLVITIAPQAQIVFTEALAEMGGGRRVEAFWGV